MSAELKKLGIVWTLINGGSGRRYDIMHSPSLSELQTSAHREIANFSDNLGFRGLDHTSMPDYMRQVRKGFDNEIYKYDPQLIINTDETNIATPSSGLVVGLTPMIFSWANDTALTHQLSDKRTWSIIRPKVEQKMAILAAIDPPLVMIGYPDRMEWTADKALATCLHAACKDFAELAVRSSVAKTYHTLNRTGEMTAADAQVATQFSQLIKSSTRYSKRIYELLSGWGGAEEFADFIKSWWVAEGFFTVLNLTGSINSIYSEE